jgi:hypothetical protein
MRSGIVVDVTAADRTRLEAIVGNGAATTQAPMAPPAGDHHGTRGAHVREISRWLEECRANMADGGGAGEARRGPL